MLQTFDHFNNSNVMFESSTKLKNVEDIDFDGIMDSLVIEFGEQVHVASDAENDAEGGAGSNDGIVALDADKVEKTD